MIAPSYRKGHEKYSMINLIWAQSKNNVIADENQIPWFLKSDLDHFKKLTTNQVVLMGANTYDSLPTKPLPDRINLVLSHRHQTDFVEGIQKIELIDQAIKIADESKKDLFIIGGKEIYQKTISIADCLYQTVVDVNIDNGLKMNLDLSDFELVEKNNYYADANNQYNFLLNKYRRKW